ncbi:hypothetical protein HaLaN_17962 [Haematococcus lacustris]|uniref:Uncharacterized protein n=1 Tax=Haematococcus lacustris TaxID=44745 RepID=A0A699ZPY3_HAELA|nr:hypothetical protein HaLaN_17962 [Haematococcus lacustris]
MEITKAQLVEDFKGMLATRLPLEARSMCSDLDGTAAGAVSVDTTVTVAV